MTLAAGAHGGNCVRIIAGDLNVQYKISSQQQLAANSGLPFYNGQKIDKLMLSKAKELLL
jgi:hypothetical protein